MNASRNFCPRSMLSQVLLMFVVCGALAFAVDAVFADQNQVTPAQISGAGDEQAAAAPRTPRDPISYGAAVAAPAAVAIILAIVTRQVVPALILGLITGAYMMWSCLPLTDPYAAVHPIIGGFRLAAERYFLGAIYAADDGYSHLKIIVFTLVIGFLVGVIGRNGGTTGLVQLVAGNATSQRRGTLTAWFAGLVVFFDDYANTMIVGPTMRSVFDRLKISRAKLAYIVDSTAAPVASLALIGTWVGAEISYIQDGLDQLGDVAWQAFLLDAQGNPINGMTLFLQSIPYRFYPIMALILVFWVALTGRDFGPMRKAQAKALIGEEDRPYETEDVPFGEELPRPRAWLGVTPILVLVGATLVVLYVTGRAGVSSPVDGGDPEPLWKTASDILGNADSYLSIFYGAIFSALVAVVLTFAARACPLKTAVDAGLNGMARMFPAVVILVLAWSLSQVEQDLQLGAVVSNWLQAEQFPVQWIPLAIFLASAGVSFATGSSWATMGLLCPVAVTVTAELAAGLEVEYARVVFYSAVGSVLAGSIFGDHCSPISDTTVLSSIAAGCRHEDHVWTQLPYALSAAVVAMLTGEITCNVLKQPWYFGMAGGAVALFLLVRILGRKPEESRFGIED